MTRSGVDEVKLIGLLWRESSTGRRSGLSTAGVTALAVELADRDGLDALTIRRLADEAGVTAMALYPHIGGRAELVELMLDRVAAATYDHSATVSDTGAPWRERALAVADANWRSCQAHPWITDVVAGRPVPGPGASVKYEVELGVFDGIGLTDVEMEHALTALLSLVEGAARSVLAERRARRPGESGDTDWWARIEPAFTAAIGDSDRFPVAARVSRALGEQTGKASDAAGAYRYGVDALLDGIEVRVGRARRESSR